MDKPVDTEKDNTLYKVTLQKILQANNYTIFVLKSEGKQFGIYASPSTGEQVQRYLHKKESPRPQTHDLIDSIFCGLNVEPVQLILNRVDETLYFARLFLKQEQKEHLDILEIDARPSDGLILSVIHQFPVFCTKHVLDNSLPFTQ